MNYYRSTITGKFVSGNMLPHIADIFGYSHTIEEVLIPVEPPSIVDCILQDSMNVGILRYRELNPERSWDEAYKMVKQIRKDVLRFKCKTEREDHQK